jgi:hypothetical protein
MLSAGLTPIGRPRIVCAMSRYCWYAFTNPGAAFGASGTENAR